MSKVTHDTLAVDGGEKLRTAPWPQRFLFGKEEKAAADRMFDQCAQTGGVFAYGGAEEEAYCKEFCEFMGGGFADGVNSGTSAVYVALRALDLPPFSEVIVPPVTDPGGVMPVPLLNLVPVPADCAPGSYNMGPEQIEARITERTSAILVAHVTGIPCDMDPILELARKHGLKVVEDCAQAHGATYKGKLVGTFGDTAAFSTMSGKHHATGGQGGVVYTQQEDLYWAARRASDRGKPFGVEGESTYVTASHNLNLDDLSAAIGREQLRKLPKIIDACRCVGYSIADKVRDLKSVTVDLGPPESQSVFWFVSLRVDPSQLTCDYNTFVRAAAAEGAPFAGPYVKPVTYQTWYQQKNVFGLSGYPWAAPEYTGDADASYPTPNWEGVNESVFRLKVHEGCAEQEAEDAVAILRKVEAAYLK